MNVIELSIFAFTETQFAITIQATVQPNCTERRQVDANIVRACLEKRCSRFLPSTPMPGTFVMQRPGAKHRWRMRTFASWRYCCRRRSIVVVAASAAAAAAADVVIVVVHVLVVVFVVVSSPSSSSWRGWR